jgi:phosphoglucosamine mutase
MADSKLFGTDGIRGVANQFPMTAEIALEVGRATAYLFGKRNKNFSHPTKVVIGKDTRLSGYMIENALASGFCSMGANVFLVGPMPTPAISFLTKNMRADIGVVISASHNSYQYNGIKIFDSKGLKLPDSKEAEIEKLMNSELLKSIRPTEDAIGGAKRIDDAMGRYIVFIKNTFPQELTLEGLRIVVDCANGAAYKIAPTVLSELGAEVFAMNDEPNGKNINEQCGALHPQTLSKSVHEHRAEIGIALDGDADRAILIDEKGEIIDGDQMMAICALDMIQSKTLLKNTLVTTPMSNLGLEIAIKNAGGQIVKTAVGDRYVTETMLKEGFNFGGEQSGHLIFLDHNTTGDGLIAALKILAIMKKTGKRLSELKQCMQIYPQIIENIRVKEKKDFSTFPKITEIIHKIQNELGSKGRVFVRYSGTEPLARVMVEGENIEVIQEYASDISKAIRFELS